MRFQDYFKKNEQFFRDNLSLFIGMLILGICGYVYHFIMARMLGPAEYSTLGALFAIIYIASVLLYIIQLTTTKAVVHLNVKREYGRISYILKNPWKLLLFGAMLFLVIVISQEYITSFLKLSASYLIIVGMIIVSMMVLPLNRGVMQGLQRFGKLGTNYIIEGLGKIGFGISLVVMGLALHGALAAILLSYILAYIFTFPALKDMLKREAQKTSLRIISKGSVTTAAVLLSLTLFYSLDALLVKHFFDATNAGYYMAVSLMGKVIFFGSYSIVLVMFPKAMESSYLKKRDHGVLQKSVLLIAMFSIPLILFYSLFPYIAITMFFGSKYYAIKSMVGMFAILMAVFSINNALAFYKMSTDPGRGLVPGLLFFNIMQVVLIIMFHETLMQVILASMTVMLVMFLFLLVLVAKKR